MGAAKDKIVSIKELEKNVKMQKLIVFEHFFKKKGIKQLSEILKVNPLDLRFFVNSIEAYNLYNDLKEELQDFPEVSSIEELKEYIIEKTMKFFDDCKTPKEAADMIEKIVPQIVNLESTIRGIKFGSEAPILAEYEVQDNPQVLGGRKKSFQSNIELLTEHPKLYNEEELEEISNDDKVIEKLEEEDGEN